MSLLDDLGGFLDDARTQLARVDSVVKQGEALHRAVSSGATGQAVGLSNPANIADAASSANTWLGPIAIVAGVLVLVALAKGVRS